MTRILLGLVLVLGLVGPARATTIFSDDFEYTQGAVTSTGASLDTCSNATCTAMKAHGWDFVRANTNTYNTMTMVAGSSLAFTNPRGGTVLRYEYREDNSNETVPTQDAHNANLIKLFNPFLSEIYGRVYFATDVDNTSSSATSSQWHNSGTKLHYIKPNTPAPYQILGYPFTAVSPPGAPISMGTAEYAICPAGGTAGNKGGSGCGNSLQNTASRFIKDKQWYCVEYHIKLNSSASLSDGMVEVWIDGTLVQQYPTAKMWDNAPNTLANSKIEQIEVYRQHANHMYRYEDDLVWGTTRIGCSSAPPPVDTTPPTPPTGLTVN